jgi:hypothetical protein
VDPFGFWTSSSIPKIDDLVKSQKVGFSVFLRKQEPSQGIIKNFRARMPAFAGMTNENPFSQGRGE